MALVPLLYNIIVEEEVYKKELNKFNKALA
jgi:hypothetical protein